MKKVFTILTLVFLFFQAFHVNAQEWILEHALDISQAPTGVLFDNNDSMWFISQGAGLFEIVGNAQISHSNAAVNSDLTTFQIEGEGIWVGGYGGGGHYSNGVWQNFNGGSDLQGYAIYAMSIVNGSIWIAMENEGASYFNGSTWDHYDASDGIVGNWHTCIAQNNNGEVFLGSVDWNNNNSYINQFDGTSWSTLEIPNFSEVTSIFVDSQDHIWVGGSGLQKYDGTSWTDFSSSLSGNNIYAINGNGDGKVYFAGFNSLVGFVEGNTATIIDTPDNLSYKGRPNGIAFDAQGEVYFCMGPPNLVSNASYGIYRYGDLVITDCSGMQNGTAFVDDCGDCVGGETGLAPCIQDCFGTEDGTAFLDDCGDCVGGETGQVPCVQDCNGDFGGTALLDDCGDCVGGDTGLAPCVQDCNGDFGGTALLDDCGECVGGDTGLVSCVQDCNGDFGGTALLDDCGECVGGNTGAEPCMVGIEELTFENLHLYPNPVTQHFYLSNNSPFKHLIIYNLLGNKVKEFTSINTHYDIQNLATGTYFVQIINETNKQSKTLPFVKIK